ncbi:MAG: SDR family oxidoreductase [Chloroflexota bacterium]|nr:SDR family oxidoreductase [Chloroflexota bacterium]
MKVREQVAIVTGAGRGLGRSLAVALAKEGAHVVVTARTREEIEVTARLVQTLGRRALALPADVSDARQVASMVQTAIQEFGTVHILINNAGIYGPIGPLHLLNDEEWWQTLKINLGGTVLCTRAILPYMMRQGAGKIINISGGGATAPRPNFSAYATSKAAVVRFTETVAQEVRQHNIQVNAVAPGGLNTTLIDAILEARELAGADAVEEARQLKAGIATPMEAVADLVLFLASSDSNGLTGRLISARWDDWRSFKGRISDIMASELYTLRRISPDAAGPKRR